MEEKFGILFRGGIAAALTLLVAMPAQALQGLCDHSPENPTAILGLLSGAAAAYPVVRARLGQWRRRAGNISSNQE
jgi:XrtJ-associated TM-motif-TM protein